MDGDKKQLIIDFINKGKVEIDSNKLKEIHKNHNNDFYEWELKPNNTNVKIICNISSYSIADLTASPDDKTITNTSIILDHEFLDDDSLLELKLLTETRIVYMTILTENFDYFLAMLK